MTDGVEAMMMASRAADTKTDNPLMTIGSKGYDDRQTGYDDRQRGGYDDRQQRGGYEDRGGGYDSYRGGGYGDRREGGYQDDRGYSNAPGPYHDRGAPGGRGGYDRRYEGGAVAWRKPHQGYQGGEAPAPQNAEYHELMAVDTKTNDMHMKVEVRRTTIVVGLTTMIADTKVVETKFYDDVNRGRERSRSPVGRQ